ncbi:MAG TPA: hypothetical protein VI542_07420 [Candidatus Tectomicrobia bacterium]
MPSWPDIDVSTIPPGPYLDVLVAEKVLAWHRWRGGEVQDTRTFVVNPVTRAIERCRPWSITGGCDYPECNKTYAFSTNREDALEVLTVIPMETMPGIPEDAASICRLALQWTQRMILTAEDCHE